jgi:hypothetical protein
MGFHLIMILKNSLDEARSHEPTTGSYPEPDESCLQFQTPSLTHSWSWKLLKNPRLVKLLKNFPALYGNRRFITVFTRVLHWSLSSVRSIQSITSNFISLRYILILSTHSGLFSSDFPTNILHAFLFSQIVVYDLPISSSLT